MIVRVDLTHDGVAIRDRAGQVRLTAPATRPILSRMGGAKRAYFRAALDGDHSLDLGDRVEGPSW